MFYQGFFIFAIIFAEIKYCGQEKNIYQQGLCMNKKFQETMEQLIPFILLGIGLAFAVGLLIMFFYVLVWGIIIGGIIWLVYFIKNYFFPSNAKKSKSGRIIEHNDKNKR